LGFSFGFNQNEGPEQTIKEEELIHLLVDVVSKNGNLLLNVGPKADGTIPSIQLSRLHALGRWLSVNGEAIYGTRPWERAEGETSEGIDVRFTRQGDSIYAILFAKPLSRQVIIKSMSIPAGSRISMLGASKALEYSTSEGNLIVTLPLDIPVAHAYTLKIDMPD
jgi:alpha-L-fucosidase